MFKDLSIKSKLTIRPRRHRRHHPDLLALAYNNFAKLSDANRWDRHTLEVLLETNHIATSVLQVQASTRGYHADRQRAPGRRRSRRKKPRRAPTWPRSLRADRRQPGQQERLRQLEPMLDNWIDNVDHAADREAPRQLNKAPGVLAAGRQLPPMCSTAPAHVGRDPRADRRQSPRGNRLLALRSERVGRQLQKIDVRCCSAPGGLVCVVLRRS